MPGLLLGLDCGLTNTKAVVWSEDGEPLGSGSQSSRDLRPRPGWVEKDPDDQWKGAAEAVREALQDAGVDGADIAAIGTTAHGDGIYILDADKRPVRPAISSLDGRAGDIVQRWSEDGTAERALELVGEAPNAVEPPVLLAWLKEHERESYDRIAHAFWCKDWLRFRLTGEIATDPTEASTGFTGLDGQGYEPEALVNYGLEELREALPPIVGCAEVAGEVTREAAEATGLKAGTPVVCGLHDCDASALGVGAIVPGQLTMIAGTFSINEVVSEDPVRDARFACRNAPIAGQWMNMANSASSATNLEWFVRKIAPLEVQQAKDRGESPFGWVGDEVASVLDEDSRVLFLPFLYGSFEHPDGTAVLFGLRGHHDRAHVLRAMFEGIAFSHRTHVDALRDHFTLDAARLAGGGAQSDVWAQVFADVINMPVTVTAAAENGSLGAAICAGVASGHHADVVAGADAWVRERRTFEPQPERVAWLEEANERYHHLVSQLGEAWERAAQ